MFMEEFDEDVEEGDFMEEDDSALSYDDDDCEDCEGLVEENPFGNDAPPQAALLDFSAPQDSPCIHVVLSECVCLSVCVCVDVNLEPLDLKDILPPGTKRRARPDFK